MAVLTGLFPGGCADHIRRYADRIECAPRLSDGQVRSGMTNHTYIFRGLLIGEPGEQVHLVIHWPEYDMDKVDKEKNEYWYVHSYALVARDAFFCGTDEIHWTHIDDVRQEGFDFFLTVTIPEGRYLYVCVNIPFTGKALEQLCVEFKDYRVPLGKTAAGMEIPMFRFGTGKRVIWLQANQHITEVSGCHVLTALMRRLVEPDVDLKDFTFFVIPSVSVDKLIGDMADMTATLNINRNWGQKEYQPENKAIIDFHKALVADGCEMLVMVDMHNGWCREGDSGGNYTEFNRGFIDDKYWQRRMRFSRAMLSTIDYERPDKLWYHDFAPIRSFNMYGSQTYGCLCSTMEFSRFSLWDQKKGGYVPQTQEGLYKMGRQYADFLLSYDYDADEK